MTRVTTYLSALLLAAAAAVLSLPSQADSGLMDRLSNRAKQKAEDKAGEKIDQSIDQAVDGATEGTTPAEESEDPEKTKAAEAAEAGESQSAESSQAAPGKETAKGATAAAEDMTLYTKFDFVPGDKVIFCDDLSGEEIGEFPSRWNLDNGVFEVVKQGKQSFIMCSDEGYVRPRVTPGALPPKYTVEMDFFSKGGERRGHWYAIEWMGADDDVVGEFQITDDANTVFRLHHLDKASKALPAKLAAGKHTMRVMATKSSIKCYIDAERVANVPALADFAPVGLRVHMDPWTDDEANPMLMGNFRYAEGGKTLKQQLDEEGRIVTHGILFDTGSDKIRAESYKTLADIGQLLADSPDLRLSIEGHTDSDGADDYNVTLSQQRATAVRAYLTGTYGVDGGRLQAKGWGEAKPIDVNTTPEGKANNRRVELVKL
jgi:OmpA-OmpF porin, OOP family